MKILGLLFGHNSSCALISQTLVGAISEERLTRSKNSTDFPRESSFALLGETSITADELDCVVVASRAIPFVKEKNIEIYNEERVGVGTSWQSRVKLILNEIHYRMPFLKPIFSALYQLNYRYLMSSGYQRLVTERIKRELKCETLDVVYADHHLCHAYTAFYGFVPHQERKKPFLVFTLDGEGDGLCATISTVADGEWRLVSKTKAGNSIASFYGSITKFLGMKINEHEYKVMGLAPYCTSPEIQDLANLFRSQFTINPDLSFSAIGGGNYFDRWLPAKLKHKRFDLVAAAAQLFVEEIAAEWIQLTIHKYGISNVVLSGGFFMNIKVNQHIRTLKAVDKMIVCPSGGDESIALGAAYYGLKLNGIEPGEAHEAKSLYLGTAIHKVECEALYERIKADGKYKAEFKSDIVDVVAQLLADNKIVAHVDGRMEFGARALGNRSILANASNTASVRTINKQIKGRDFWMPFACSMLEEKADMYLDVDTYESLEYMAVGANTKPLAKKHLAAGIHQYDGSARPQIVKKEQNQKYHAILSRYHELTGMGGFLNTSLNLHGEPLVCSAEDAFSTFERSGLEYLVIRNLLISKNGMDS
ncbi:carbamoyltransferase C-terminal domain-containing protein [Candidatus Puniceispirillum marinum]|uniref:Predicted carbamoyl transferase, NodU family n=1 Tax=Puniceispirillum marinum (strain IMCC1322) TaxID=488538 RepID=D5BSI3_PUNMI|nr:carbamoyltransferase C-terminal domain-containing protein [Candidatus Puniceispirillum marinum]ADE39230.1 predicted carbamoyl transferase, NodU family [Candidatus Puniceispirillum marinum IMCC1322]